MMKKRDKSYPANNDLFVWMHNVQWKKITVKGEESTRDSQVARTDKMMRYISWKVSSDKLDDRINLIEA